MCSTFWTKRRKRAKSRIRGCFVLICSSDCASRYYQQISIQYNIEFEQPRELESIMRRLSLLNSSFFLLKHVRHDHCNQISFGCMCHFEKRGGNPALPLSSLPRFLCLVEGKTPQMLRYTFQFMRHKVHCKDHWWVVSFLSIDAGLKFDLDRIICTDFSVVIHLCYRSAQANR